MQKARPFGISLQVSVIYAKGTAIWNQSAGLLQPNVCSLNHEVTPSLDSFFIDTVDSSQQFAWQLDMCVNENAVTTFKIDSGADAIVIFAVL